MTAPTTVPAPTTGAGRPGYITARHRQVLALAANGHSNRSIGTRLGLKESSIKTHIKRALHTLDARDRTHAVVIALLTGQLTATDIRQAATW